MSHWIRRAPLAAYFIITYLISWAIALPLAARALGWLTLPLPFAIHYLIPLGPLLAAVIVTRVTAGEDGLRDLYARITRWRVGAGWVLFAILAPLVVFFMAAAVSPLFGAARTDLRDLGTVNFLPSLGIGAWVLWFLTFGIGEETGWRGFALRRIQARRSAFAATLLLSIPWAVWHVPSLFYLGNLSQLGILLPGSMNFVTASRAGAGTNAAVVSMAFVVWGILIIFLYGRENLARRERDMIGG